MAGRPSNKKTEEIIETKPTVTGVIDTEKEDLKKQNEQMAEMLKQMQEQLIKLQSAPQVVVAQTTSNGLSGKKIKCINLMNNMLNVSTEPNGMGRVFSFDKYGDTRLINFDLLTDIVASYPNTVENGFMFIANKDAVEELGLTEEYKKIYTKDMIDELVYLRRENDVDLFIGMNKDLQESTARRIAELLNANETMDLNYLRKIKDETEIDIELIAKDLKEFDVKIVG